MAASESPQNEPGRACSCVDLTMALLQFAGLIVGAAVGARHGWLFGILGALGGVLAGSMVALVLMLLVGLVVVPLAMWEERREAGRRSGPVEPDDEEGQEL